MALELRPGSCPSSGSHILWKRITEGTSCFQPSNWVPTKKFHLIRNWLEVPVCRPVLRSPRCWEICSAIHDAGTAAPSVSAISESWLTRLLRVSGGLGAKKWKAFSAWPPSCTRTCQSLYIQRSFLPCSSLRPAMIGQKCARSVHWVHQPLCLSLTTPHFATGNSTGSSTAAVGRKEG